MKKVFQSSLVASFAILLSAGTLYGQAPSVTHGDSQLAKGVDAAAQPLATGNKPHDDSFVIGNDDMLSINVWKEPDITRSIPVRSDGKISLPLVGEVQAAGRTPLQLETEITSRLRAYIAAPEVTVMVQQINSEKFNILGQIVKPGAYSLTSGTTVLDAIATSGGFRDFAKKKDIYVLRQGSNGEVSRITFNYSDVIKGKHPEENIALRPRDTVIVP